MFELQTVMQIDHYLHKRTAFATLHPPQWANSPTLYLAMLMSVRLTRHVIQWKMMRCTGSGRMVLP